MEELGVASNPSGSCPHSQPLETCLPYKEMNWLRKEQRLLGCQVSKFGSVSLKGHEAFSRECLTEELGHGAGWADGLTGRVHVPALQNYLQLLNWALTSAKVPQLFPLCVISSVSDVKAVPGTIKSESLLVGASHWFARGTTHLLPIIAISS